jgi:hypothetical protein
VSTAVIAERHRPGSALLKMDCPTFRPITAVVRIGAMEQRLDAMLRAINIGNLLCQNSMAH